MSYRPHKPIEHDVRQAERSELVVGRWLKTHSRGGTLRTVWLRQLSECGRYALISFSEHGPTRPCNASELMVYVKHSDLGLPE